MESATTTTTPVERRELERRRARLASRAARARIAGRGAPRLPRPDQAADHLAAAGDDGRDDVSPPTRRARRCRRCSGRCSAATWRRVAPEPSTTTSTATATRAWRGPARAPWSRGGSSPLTASSSGSPWARSPTAQLALTVNALAAALALAGPARLRLRLHDLAEAADAAEHRHRRRRRRGATAGRLGGGDGRAGAGGAVPVRDRLPLDPAPLLGALAADQGRLRPHRRADAAGGQGRGRRPAARSSLYTLILTAFTCCRCSPASSARSTSSRRSRSAPASPPSRSALLRSPPGRAALRLYLSSLAYLALLFCAMAARPGRSDRIAPWTADRASETSDPARCAASLAVGVFGLAFFVAIIYIG